ncbi:hypothetical protein [Streptococcus cuniculi]|uniref:Uncharacterized protein n=1 Tax=Streptococcus cuniculi TaxID=1432788 RepID=A0A4Y9JFB4_9STRE|nr:hypothetical protein [Streptococcus cuniculi]MBF0777473.1 hypothetical protein [Streptococcus cuniculi]TFU98525.1 hypothetical protein E4T82_01800 [Streptococcus cuniculi]
MAVTDKNIQDIVKSQLKDGISDNQVIRVGQNSNIRYYKVINHINDVTQGLAVVPVDDSKGTNPQYNQAIITIAGTQMPWDDSNPNVSDRWTSTSNAFGAQKGLTAQTKDIDDFYQQTLSKNPNVTVQIISGHSQAGPGTAKIGANHQVPRIYNFQPWASVRAVQNGDFTKEELGYLNKHAIVYSDAGKDVTYMDGGKGRVTYGQVYTVEGTLGPLADHDVNLFKIKGNALDIDYYVKNGVFCSGMTEDQVRQVAKKKAKDTWWDWDDDAEVKRLMAEYKDKYGSFASKSAIDDVRSKNKKARKDLKTASGAKAISLREEIVRSTAQIAHLQSEEYEKEVQRQLLATKERVQDHVTTFTNQVYAQVSVLPSYEVAGFLAELTMETVWDEGIESQTLAAAKTYREALHRFSASLDEVADHIIETDQSGVLLFE